MLFYKLNEYIYGNYYAKLKKNNILNYLTNIYVNLEYNLWKKKNTITIKKKKYMLYTYLVNGFNLQLSGLVKKINKRFINKSRILFIKSYGFGYITLSTNNHYIQNSDFKVEDLNSIQNQEMDDELNNFLVMYKERKNFKL